METTVHNPDRYMGDLRQILAQGRKRIGILLGAGAPASILIDEGTGKLSNSGKPLIPTIDGLTRKVLESLDKTDSDIIKKVSEDLEPNPNIEKILSRIRSLSEVIGCNSIYGCDGSSLTTLSDLICEKIGVIVKASLPEEGNPYTELASWISGANRLNPIEVFTPNYDLLMEEALERRETPYFDGFSGGFEPFFDPVSISNCDLPSRWARLWKLHGSLGWAVNGHGGIIRGKGREANKLIYPDHLKYDKIQKLPFTALFDRLRKFLTTPDTLLLTCGFSFADPHIIAVIDEALVANPAGSVFAFQYKPLDDETAARALARKRPNMCVYARDGAVLNCIAAPWVPGELPSPNWQSIRASFWGKQDFDKGGKDNFLLGDFTSFSRFLALTHAERMKKTDSAGSEVAE
jgi:hypothetical protein